ncbi:BspA family leucine-rich repeat surface protein, partial [Enterococcus faecalis]|nr:BspA family leucine-rich repeat surface protein [Enterococcus faecalis]
MKKSISVVTIVSLFSSILLPTVVMAEDSELKVSNGKESTIISEETKDVAGESSENNEKTELVDNVETDLSKSNQDNVAINSDQSIVENESVFKEEKETASASISLEEQGKENEKQSSNETEEKKQENIENSDGVVQEEENTGEIQEEQDVINNDLKNEDREDTKSMDNVETFNSNGTERADWNISSETATEIILEKYKGSSKEIVIPTELDGKQVVVQNWKILLPDDITSLTVKEVNNRKIKLYSNASNIFTFKTNLRTVDLHGLDVASVTNMSSMFRRCRSLESVEGLRDWDVSSVTDMSDMFNNCTSLNNVEGLRDWDVSSVTNMSRMFFVCTSLNNVEGLRDWDVSSVTGMNDMFNNCTSLNNVEVLKGWDVSSVTSMNDMFNSCTSLNNVEELRDWDVSSVTSMSRMFSDCRSLESVEELRDWDVSSVANMDNMFRYCSSLEVVDLSGWKTDSLQNISRMFSDSNNLKAVDLSGFTLDKINSPMSNIFYNTSLTDTPLLVIAKDGKLKNYNYESDKRIPTKNIFDANSGAFDNGDTEHSAKHVYVIEDTENATINELIENAKTSVGIPTKTGYTFGGWEENTVRTRINNLLEVYNKLTATYKAKWTANEYKIKFDANGGTGIMPDQAMKYDQAEKLTKNEYTKEGYTFKGWSITPDGNVVYSDEVEVKNLTNKANDSITLYAVWEINNYNVTFDSQGGSSVDGQNVEYNAVVEKPTDPTKEGYTFGGWYKEAECITAWNFDTDKMPAGNITLYAKWILNTSELNHVP